MITSINAIAGLMDVIMKGNVSAHAITGALEWVTFAYCVET